MRVGLLSDSHDRVPALEAGLAILRERGVAMLLHAGDFVAPFAAKRLHPDVVGVPVHACYGNNDGERRGLRRVLPVVEEGPVRLELGGRVVVMDHFRDWLSESDVAGADVVVTGHTHEASVEWDGHTLWVNPGEVCGWVTGRCSVAVLELGGDRPEAELVWFEG
ncbi:MAG: metallophosphoesterase [Planctomycetota bacterium]